MDRLFLACHIQKCNVSAVWFKLWRIGASASWCDKFVCKSLRWGEVTTHLSRTGLLWTNCALWNWLQLKMWGKILDTNLCFKRCCIYTDLSVPTESNTDTYNCQNIYSLKLLCPFCAIMYSDGWKKRNCRKINESCPRSIFSERMLVRESERMVSAEEKLFVDERHVIITSTRYDTMAKAPGQKLE